MTNDLRGKIGALFMAAFGVIALQRWHESGYLFFLLLAVREFVAVYGFMTRTKPEQSAGWRPSLIAWGSTVLPLCYITGSSALSPIQHFVFELTAIVGFGIAAIATVDLGRSLGVSPARRALVQTGIYRWIKHPMYLGYVISELGWLFVAPVNLGIFAMSVALYIFRQKLEEQFCFPGNATGKNAKKVN